ncbi:MAG: heparan-alpha-glucosaminide N-acetyltransferase domain-containing protein [Promethearchaeia archaeon]
MRRLKSIDIFRGLCIFYMAVGHQIEWWITEGDYWLYEIFWNLGAPFGGGGFLLISGISAALSYRFKMSSYKHTHAFSKQSIRDEYMFRALLILVVSFIWNFGAVLFGLVDMGIKGIWLWFVLQTIGISLILAWPLLKVSRTLRVIFAFSIWIGNEFIFLWLLPFKSQANGFGLLYHILYNVQSQNPILGYFPFLLMGTVIGDTLYEIFYVEPPEKRKLQLKKKVYLPYIIGGFFLTIFGILFYFPAFLSKETFSSHLFIFGIELLGLALLLWLKDDKVYQLEKSYRLFIYYSFYSFSIFLGHHVLFFLFPQMLNAFEIWFFILPATAILTLLWRFIYEKIGRNASLKAQISRLATHFSEIIERMRRDSVKQKKKVLNRKKKLPVEEKRDRL